MLRCSASISSRSSSPRTSSASSTRGAQIRPHVDQLGQAHARQPLHDDAQAAVGQLEHLVNVAGGADRIQIFLQRLVFAGFALREDRDQAAARHRLVDQADRALARHRQRHERVRETAPCRAAAAPAARRAAGTPGCRSSDDSSTSIEAEVSSILSVRCSSIPHRRAVADPIANEWCSEQTNVGRKRMIDAARCHRSPALTWNAGERAPARVHGRGVRVIPAGRRRGSTTRDAARATAHAGPRFRGPLRSPCSGPRTAAHADAPRRSRRRTRSTSP